MDNLEIFFGKKKQKRIEICQDHNKLNTITKFDYDLNNKKFVKYFEQRTGIIISKMEQDFKKVLNPKNKPKETHTLITMQKIQDCWGIYNV